MSNSKTAGSRTHLEVFFAVLFAVLGLASCGGGGGGGGSEAAAAPAIPSVTITASPSSIASGGLTTLSWSATDITDCTFSYPGYSGLLYSGALTNTSGTLPDKSPSATITYTVTCNGPGGTASQGATVTVAVLVPTVTSFYALPPSIGTGATTTLNWASSNSSGCTLTGAGLGAPSITVLPTGSRATGSLFAAATYTLTCTDGSTTSPASSAEVLVDCQTTGATGAITLPNMSSIPARTIGVAPLAVFFDAFPSPPDPLTGAPIGITTTPPTTRPFQDLEYRWDFSDSANLSPPFTGASTWNAGSRAGASSRNTATGPVAAHVYETPGTYTVKLDVTDGTNMVSNSCIRITVRDPDLDVFAGPNTICIGATSLPVAGTEIVPGSLDGCPAGARTALQSNFATAINTYALANQRVLFKRGDTFTSATSASITHDGPGTIGAFGTGAAPILRMTGNTVILNLSNRSTPAISDWRVMDLDLDGMLTPSSPTPLSEGVRAVGGINQVTLLRLSIHDVHDGISLTAGVLDYQNSTGYPGHTMWDQIAIADSSILRIIGTTGGVGIAGSGKHFSMLGNIGDDAILGEHVVRLFYLNKAVISNNTLSRQAPTKGVIKMHGPTWCDTAISACNYLTDPLPVGVAGVAGGYTEQVVLSDNKLVSADSTSWTVNIAPQDSYKDERLRNIIVERNWFVPGNMTSAALALNAVEVTIRNNIFEIPNSAGILVHGTGSPEPPPADIRVYNNTFYSASTGDFYGVYIHEPSTNITVYNNLGVAPLATVPLLSWSPPKTAFVTAPVYWSTAMVNEDVVDVTTVQGSNLFSNETPSALFVTATPAVPADFRLKALPNPARDTGASGVLAVPVFSDFFGTLRPQSGVPGTIDIGAVEGP